MKSIKIAIKVLLVVVGGYLATTLVSIALSRVLIYFGSSTLNATMYALIFSFIIYALIVMAFFAKSEFRKSMTHLHTWSGLVVGWFLFFIFITGSAGYFDEEIDSWMEPELRFSLEKYSNEELINKALYQLDIEAHESKKWQIYLPSKRDNHLKIRYALETNRGKNSITSLSFGHGQNSTTKIIDPNTNKSFKPREDAGGQTLYRMHYVLHYIPRVVGFYIVGVFSMLMLIALLSSLVIHANIFKDYFALRRGKNVRSWLDAHVLSGVVALPYFIMITYSGLLFLMFFYLPLVPMANYENGVREFKKELSSKGKIAHFKDEYAPLYSISKIVEESEKIFTDRARRVTIANPNDTSSIVLVERSSRYVIPHNRDDKLYFSGVSGKLLEKKELNLPLSNEIKKTFLGLHRALFADTTLRLFFFFSGILGAIMLATGLILWTKKREHAQSGMFGFRVVNALNIGTIIGLPSAIGVYFLSNKMLNVSSELKSSIEINYLYSTWGVFILFAFMINSKKAWFIEAYVAVCIYLALVIHSLLQKNFMIDLYFNIFFLFIAVLFSAVGQRVRKRVMQ